MTKFPEALNIRKNLIILIYELKIKTTCLQLAWMGPKEAIIWSEKRNIISDATTSKL